MTAQTPPDRGSLEAAPAAELPPPKRVGGPCEECRANRQRLVSLAADVSGFRRLMARWDGLDLTDVSERIDRIEWVVYGVAALLVLQAVQDARRGPR